MEEGHRANVELLLCYQQEQTICYLGFERRQGKGDLSEACGKSRYCVGDLDDICNRIFLSQWTFNRSANEFYSVENFKPGTMDRLGLGYSRLEKVNPRIIYASISGELTFLSNALRKSRQLIRLVD